jgi:hypothetical protein
MLISLEETIRSHMLGPFHNSSRAKSEVNNKDTRKYTNIFDGTNVFHLHMESDWSILCKKHLLKKNLDLDHRFFSKIYARPLDLDPNLYIKRSRPAEQHLGLDDPSYDDDMRCRDRSN